MIGARAGIGRVAFDGVETIELRLVAFEAAPRREPTGMTDARGPRAEEVGVEREDDVGLVDGVLRVDIVAEGELAACPRVVTAGNPDVPAPALSLGSASISFGVRRLFT